MGAVYAKGLIPPHSFQPVTIAHAQPAEKPSAARPATSTATATASRSSTRFNGDTVAGYNVDRADVAELVDAHGSGPCGGNPVEVQVLSSAFPPCRRFYVRAACLAHCDVIALAAGQRKGVLN